MLLYEQYTDRQKGIHIQAYNVVVLKHVPFIGNFQWLRA